MGIHRFRLLFSGVSESTPELANALFEAAGGVIEFNLRDGNHGPMRESGGCPINVSAIPLDPA